MKIIGITDSYPIHPRLEKVTNYFSKSNKYVKYISWDRKNISKEYEDNYIYTETSEYGNKLDKLLKIFGYRSYIKQIIKSEKPNMIVCRHWQMLFLVNTISLKDIRIIYDVCDIPNSKLIRCIEKIMIKRCHKIVLASRFFDEFYDKKNCIVLENRPYKKYFIPETNDNKIINKDYNESINLVFLGKVRYFETMKNMIKAICNDEIVNVNIYGDGPDEKKLIEFCNSINCKNVTFHGLYSQKDISKIYSDADLIWAAYPNKSLNVRYAISNKYHETLAYKVPGIYACNTKLSQIIQNNNVGYIVNPYDVKDIRNVINQIKINRYQHEQIKANIKNINEDLYWDDYLSSR